MNRTEMVYRKTAVEGASGFGLLIALYDTLAGNLRRAAEAERCNNIEGRCREVNHALLVVAHLEDRVRRGSGGELAETLIAFYRSLRRKMIKAQVKRSAEMLEEQMAAVLKIREVWQNADLRGMPPGPDVPGPASLQRSPGYADMASESGQGSWSA
jgi:flagellar secretion chaperone FliS